MDGFTFLLPDGTIIEPEPPKPKELPKPKKRTLAETLAFFKEIAEYFGADIGNIKVISGKSKNGRTYITCSVED